MRLYTVRVHVEERKKNSTRVTAEVRNPLKKLIGYADGVGQLFAVLAAIEGTVDDCAQECEFTYFVDREELSYEGMLDKLSEKGLL